MSDVFEKAAKFTSAEEARSTGMFPFFRPIEGVKGNKVVFQGKALTMIGSNNYLGLAHDPRVLEAAQEATRKYGSGCTGSRFLNGNMVIHETLEAELAKLLNREAVMLHSTGFFANLGTLSNLCQSGDYIICDRENHASILDGCQMSRAKTVPYAHNCMKTLERRLSHLPEEGGKLVVVDGVFSMSGDIADLKPMAKISKKYGARLYVDEAHSLGVLGPNGEGAVSHFGLEKEVDLVMGTFSKSLGSMGGFIAGPSYVIDYLKHTTRCMIFTASLAPAVVGGVLKALELMQSEPERREQLWKNTRKMHEGFRSLGFDIGTTQSPVVPILIGSEVKAMKFTQALLEAGIFVTPAMYPAVKYGRAILRTSYMASHTGNELDYVLESFERIAKQLGIFEDVAYTGDVSKLKQRKSGYGNYDFKEHESEEPVEVRAGSRSSA